jgi:hypothetical protein
MRKLTSSALLALCAAGCTGSHDPVGMLAVAPATVTLGYAEAKTFRFTWSPTAPLDAAAGTPIVFVHLLDAGGEVVRTFDHPFPRPWQPQAPVNYDVTVYQSVLAPALPAGRYRLTVGLYRAKSGERWPLEVSAGQEPLPRFEYPVAWVDVPGTSPGPRFAFSPSWLPAEPGSDRQILASRWLGAGEGTIRIDGLRGPGTLRLSVLIPRTEGPNETLEVADGTGPSVVVSATCGDMEAGFSGSGSHEFEIPVTEPPPGGSCEVRLAPNFVLRRAGSEERSVRLDNLAWAPGSRP